MSPKIMIVAGESSGELYGALLAEALKAEYQGASISGIGGVRMREAGVELIAGITSAFGGVEALKKLGQIRETFQKAISFLDHQRPDLLILIDYPSFNLRLAREAKKRGIPVIYYISPHVWAWRKWRINTIKNNVKMIALALPFELPIYEKAGVPCSFVGHPVLDEIRYEIARLGMAADSIGSVHLKERVRSEIGLKDAKMVMAVMPGSRIHEVETLLPVIIEVINRMRIKYPDCRFVLPMAPNLDDSIFLRHKLPEGCITLRGDSIKALMASDLAVIASGTSTLQAALLGVPMVVIYKLSRLSFCIAKSLVRINYISLANLLLERSAAEDSGLRVLELIQEDVNADNIFSELEKIRDDETYRAEYTLQLERVRRLFLDKNASVSTARLAANFMKTDKA